MQGIDISNWQAGMDTSKVTADFIIIKSTEGTKYTNKYMTSQASGALSSGKLIGFYHYANGGDYKSEANHFIRQIEPYAGKAILCLDWEGASNPLFAKGDLNWVKNWLDYVASVTGVTPFLYTGYSEVNYRNYSKIAAAYPLWGACYSSDSVTYYQDKPWKEGASWGAWGKNITIRQYRGTGGRVKGYSGDVDLDKAYISADQWAKYCQNKVEQKPTAPVQDKPALTYVRRGYKGDLVKACQALLNYRGYSCGDVDGVYGQKTENSVRIFQKAYGLNVDGICGKDTFAALAKF